MWAHWFRCEPLSARALSPAAQQPSPPPCFGALHLCSSRFSPLSAITAGKSSIMISTLRMVEAASGAIEIDGIDIATVPLQVLVRPLRLVPRALSTRCLGRALGSAPGAHSLARLVL